MGRWLAERAADGAASEETAVFVRSPLELPSRAVEAAGLPFALLDDHAKTARARVSVGTTHLSEGLEFGAVTVMGCDHEVLPPQARIEASHR